MINAIILSIGTLVAAMAIAVFINAAAELNEVDSCAAPSTPESN